MPAYRAVSTAFAIAPSVSVVIPAKNEGRNLPHVFAALPLWVDEVILVDGHAVSAAQPASMPGQLILPGAPDLSAATEPLWASEEPSRLHGQQHVTPNGRTFKLSILMPAYNEETTVMRAVAGVLSVNYPCDIELIVIDDGSTDGTWKLLSQIEDARVTLMRHKVNCGKGAALLSAIALATGTYLLPFDADLEYEAEDILRIVAPVLRGRCSVVFGARLFGYNTVYQSYRYAVGNRLLTRMANLLFNAYISDLHTCLKLIPLAMLKELDLKEKGFGLDSEITARLLHQGVRPFEVPVSYYSRSHAEGKKINWRDAVACVRILLSVRFRRRPRPAAAPVSSSLEEANPLAEINNTSSKGPEFPKVIRVTA
jgi:glycosyltransferase involved in cell wall biosynthesis